MLALVESPTAARRVSAGDRLPAAGPATAGPDGSRSALRLVPAPTKVPPSTYRLRQALAAGAVATVFAVACAVLGVLGDGSRSVPERPLQVGAGGSYVVQPGDTFWSIATRLDPKGDPRSLVDRLVSEHGGPVLSVGEELWLPLAQTG